MTEKNTHEMLNQMIEVENVLEKTWFGDEENPYKIEVLVDSLVCIEELFEEIPLDLKLSEKFISISYIDGPSLQKILLAFLEIGFIPLGKELDENVLTIKLIFDEHIICFSRSLLNPDSTNKLAWLIQELKIARKNKGISKKAKKEIDRLLTDPQACKNEFLLIGWESPDFD